MLPPDGWFRYLRELCDRHGILLVADEVQSGMGRTGKMWAIEHFGVEPDIVLSGKGIASGMPLGAMIARGDLMTWEVGAHGSTYGGNPVACAAALATLRLIEGGLMDNATDVGNALLDGLRAMQQRQPLIRDVRGLGLMIGVGLPRSRRRRRRREGRVPARAAGPRVRRRRHPALAPARVPPGPGRHGAPRSSRRRSPRSPGSGARWPPPSTSLTFDCPTRGSWPSSGAPSLGYELARDRRGGRRPARPEGRGAGGCCSRTCPRARP